MGYSERLYKIYNDQGQPVCEGTAQECADIMNVKVRTIQKWASPKHHEKLEGNPKPRKYNIERVKLGKGGSSKDKSIYKVTDKQGQLVCTGTAQECAEVLGIKPKSVIAWSVPSYKDKPNKRPGDNKYKAVQVGKIERSSTKEKAAGKKGGRPAARYAVYDHKGDFVCEGTAIECAKILNVQKQTISYWASPAHKRRRAESKNPSGYTADHVNPAEWEEESAMKVNVNYEDVHAAIEALKNKDELTDAERTAALKVLTAVLGDYVPTWDEILKHNRNLTNLELIDYDLRPGRWQQVADEIREFENKYC